MTRTADPAHQRWRSFEQRAVLTSGCVVLPRAAPTNSRGDDPTPAHRSPFNRKRLSVLRPCTSRCHSVGEHGASTAGYPTMALVPWGDRSSPPTFNLKLIVNEQFRALSDATGRPDEYPVIVLFSLAVRRTTVIEPPGGIASPGTIDHPRVIQREEKRVAVFGAGKSVGLLRLLPRDKCAFIFEKVRAGLEIDQRENAAAMNGRVANNDTTH